MQSNQGLTLDRYLEKSSTLDPERAARIALQLAQQLNALAGSFVIHPGRIFLDAEGVVKLLPPATEELSLPSVVEYPAYSSPEEIRGQQADLRSALYSLGCTLYQLLAGEPPYASSDPKQILHAHLEAPVPDVRKKTPAVSQALAELTSELLAKDPELRVQTPEELVRRLKQSLLSLGAALPASTTATRVAPRPAVRAVLPATRLSPPAKRPSPPAAPRSLKRSGTGLSSGVPGKAAKVAKAPPLRSAGGKANLTRHARSPSSRLDDDFDEMGDDALESGVREKKSYPFTMVGVVLGFLLGLLLMGKYFKDSEARRVNDIENRRSMAREQSAKKLSDEKDKIKVADADMQRRVAVFLRQTQGQPPETQVMKLEESLTNFSKNHYGHRVVEEYLKARAASGVTGATGGSEVDTAYAEQKAAAEKLYAEGKIALAYLKLNENSRQFRKRHGTEIDAYVTRWGEEVEQKWQTTLARAQSLGGKGDHQGVMDLLRDALATWAEGDEAVSKLIRQELATQGELAARLAQNGGKSSRNLEDDEAAAKNQAGKADEENAGAEKPAGEEPEFEDPEQDDTGSGAGDKDDT